MQTNAPLRRRVVAPATRRLDPNERALLLHVVEHLDDRDTLRAQVEHAAARTFGTPTFVDLVVGTAAPRTTRPDGPLPTHFPVSLGGHVVGELVVWVAAGRLSGLEYAWRTGSPHGLPDIDQLAALA